MNTNDRDPPPNRRVSFDGVRGYDGQPVPPVPGLRRANTISELPEQASIPGFVPPQRVGTWPTQGRDCRLGTRCTRDTAEVHV